MDILAVTLWLLGVTISHLLLRRVVEIDNMNKELLLKQSPSVVKKVHFDVKKEMVSEDQSEEDLQKELMDYVEAQDYGLPKPEFDLPPPAMANMVMTRPTNSSNIVQEFEEERALNSGSFGNLQAYEESGYATL